MTIRVFHRSALRKPSSEKHDHDHNTSLAQLGEKSSDDEVDLNNEALTRLPLLVTQIARTGGRGLVLIGR